MDKAALRRMIRDKKRAMTEAQIDKTSLLLAQKLRAHPMYQQARSLYAYLSYNQEVRTRPILEMAIADGKRGRGAQGVRAGDHHALSLAGRPGRRGAGLL